MESECLGYIPHKMVCDRCWGKRRYDVEGVHGPIIKQCKKCFGFGHLPKYRCKIRLISDNVDFAKEKGWKIVLEMYRRLLCKMSLEQFHTVLPMWGMAFYEANPKGRYHYKQSEGAK